MNNAPHLTKDAGRCVGAAYLPQHSQVQVPSEQLPPQPSQQPPLQSTLVSSIVM